MWNFVLADNQPISARPLGDAVWLTSFINPQNPEVVLKYQALTEGVFSIEDRITALWRYVARLPYKETISSRISVDGKKVGQGDAWLYPSEVMKVRVSNCANRSFLLASLLKNALPNPGEVYCMLGNITLDGIGAHAWVAVKLSGKEYFLETTQPMLEKAIVPASLASAYESKVAFDENTVYTLSNGIDIEGVLNARFGLCAVPFLRDYLCRECLQLEV